MIIVTGGAGFIGSNIAKSLNERGYTDILVVDNLENGIKFKNLQDLKFLDYIDKQDFLSSKISFGSVEAIFHQGACSDTKEWDGRYLMRNNYTFSKELLHLALDQKVPFYYASSASVYGVGDSFKEDPQYEKPVNMYAFSKYQFDNYVRNLGKLNSPVAGFRYFNVYGPNESHKGGMASTIYQFNKQVKTCRKIKLFGQNDGYGNGEQLRDFIYVRDVVEANLWLLDNPSVSGIFNLGTGQAETFNKVAECIIGYHGYGEVEYVSFPKELRGKYQSFTQADLASLREAGFSNNFLSLHEGVSHYLDWLDQNQALE